MQDTFSQAEINESSVNPLIRIRTSGTTPEDYYIPTYASPDFSIESNGTQLQENGYHSSRLIQQPDVTTTSNPFDCYRIVNLVQRAADWITIDSSDTNFAQTNPVNGWSQTGSKFVMLHDGLYQFQFVWGIYQAIPGSNQFVTVKFTSYNSDGTVFVTKSERVNINDQAAFSTIDRREGVFSATFDLSKNQFVVLSVEVPSGYGIFRQHEFAQTNSRAGTVHVTKIGV